MPEQKWTMRGEYMESCNCDYLCPCIYTNPQGPATHDHCIAVMAFRVDEGSFGATDLAGRKFALVIRSGRVMADGNWLFAAVVDDGADAAQRQALSAIVGGEAGGPPGLIRQHLVGDCRGVEFRPIEFVVDGHGASSRSGHCLVRDRRRRLAQSQRRAVLHRQYRSSGEPAPGFGAGQRNPGAGLRSRSRLCRQGQQRPLRALCLGGLVQRYTSVPSRNLQHPLASFIPRHPGEGRDPLRP